MVILASDRLACAFWSGGKILQSRGQRIIERPNRTRLLAIDTRAPYLPPGRSFSKFYVFGVITKTKYDAESRIGQCIDDVAVPGRSPTSTRWNQRVNAHEPLVSYLRALSNIPCSRSARIPHGKPSLLGSPTKVRDNSPRLQTRPVVKGAESQKNRAHAARTLV